MQTMQPNLFSCKVTLHVSGVTAPTIRSVKNSNRSLRYRYLYRRLRLQFLVLLMMGAVDTRNM
jgi:hypothetical protein